MIELILLLGMIALVIWGFTRNILIGALLFIVIGLYYYFKRYAKLCFMMALTAYAKQDIKGTFRWFERGNKRGFDASQKITYAYYLLREGRIERSEALLNSILAFPQKNKSVKFLAKANHALLLLKTDRQLEAMEELEEIFPQYKNTTIYGSLGYLYIINKNQKAESFNLEAYEYNKEDGVILDNLVQLYTQKGDFETAYRYAGELLSKKPGFIEAYYDVALVEKELGKTEDAKAHLEHALTIRPSFISAISHEDVKALLETL